MIVERKAVRHMRVMVAVLAAAIAVPAAFASRAAAAEAGVGWGAFAQAHPTNLAPGGTGTIQIVLMDTGAAHSSGPITVTDTLPEGVVATAVGGMPLGGEGNGIASIQEEKLLYGGARWTCSGIGTERISCTSNPSHLPSLPVGEGIHFEPFERLAVKVSVQANATEGTFPQGDAVSVAGGGAKSVGKMSYPLTVSSAEPEYGFSAWRAWFTNSDGTIDTQAGSHPYETTFVVGYNELADAQTAGGELRSIEAGLPPGFFGEPNTTPYCRRAQFDAQECPADTQIGYDLAPETEDTRGGPIGWFSLPVYNMVPPRGVTDEFAVTILGFQVFFNTGPQGYGDYHLITRIDNIPANKFDANILTLWGDAAEGSHNVERKFEGKGSEETTLCENGCASTAPSRPFLTLPTACGGPQQFTVSGLGTWEEPNARAQDVYSTSGALDEPFGFNGCSALAFEPSLTASPESHAADSPTGLGVDVSFPQEALRVPGQLTEATVKNATVTLPEGLVINPGQAAGLTACSQVQAKLREEGAPECPPSAKVGTVKVQTPLLEGELETELTGNVYVLEQSKGLPGERPNLQSDPPTLQLLIVLSGDGTNLKLAAEVHLNPATGQLRTNLTETPGLPFTHFELQFSGGAQAALAAPAHCGIYTTTSDFTPWTTPFAPDQSPTSAFQVTSGPEGASCPPASLPFKPELIAGATTDQAGGFTGFSLLLRRGDGQQRIERLQFKAPEGLTGMLSKVPLCAEPQAQDGSCSAASQIGHATVASGPGPYPLVIPQPGEPESPIYLTGPYGGAPFGLSIVTHVIAGPFNLGTIVTRAKIEIDPLTAQITVTTDPLPQIVDGVPTDLRLIDSVIDRPEFMVNPTDCEASSFSGTAYGAPPAGTSEPSQSAPISSHFQVGSCRSLEFKPRLEVSTSAKTSKADGASLHVQLSFPKGSLGHDANIQKVKVELPKQMPSRLGTLQKACLAEVFDADPARCRAESRVGSAKAVTPVLPVPLTGPAYFVSYGGAKFPELVVVLQGDGVSIDLHGETFINPKTSVTSSTFSAVPDQPVENFELTLPEGKYSALGATANLCQAGKTIIATRLVRRKVHGRARWVRVKATKKAPALSMPTTFIGQNGAEVRQSTVVAVTGCGEAGKASTTGRQHQKRSKRQRR
jgi:hypothetical protein